MSEWQQNSVPGGQDMHSIAGLPTFVDNTMQPQSYKLDMGSLGIGKGRNGEDIGARVQKVGNM